MAVQCGRWGIVNHRSLLCLQDAAAAAAGCEVQRGQKEATLNNRPLRWQLAMGVVSSSDDSVLGMLLDGL